MKNKVYQKQDSDSRTTPDTWTNRKDSSEHSIIVAVDSSIVVCSCLLSSHPLLLHLVEDGEGSCDLLAHDGDLGELGCGTAGHLRHAQLRETRGQKRVQSDTGRAETEIKKSRRGQNKQKPQQHRNQPTHLRAPTQAAILRPPPPPSTPSTIRFLVHCPHRNEVVLYGVSLYEPPIVCHYTPLFNAGELSTDNLQRHGGRGVARKYRVFACTRHQHVVLAEDFTTMLTRLGVPTC